MNEETIEKEDLHKAAILISILRCKGIGLVASGNQIGYINNRSDIGEEIVTRLIKNNKPAILFLLGLIQAVMGPPELSQKEFEEIVKGEEKTEG